MRKIITLGIMLLFLGMTISSSTESIVFNDDTTPPYMDLSWYAYKKNETWHIKFIAHCLDMESGMNRVEFYYNDILQETIIGPGPYYEWELKWKINYFSLIGFICQRRTTEENINFFALIVNTDSDSNFDWNDLVEVYAYNNDEHWVYDQANNPFYGMGISYYFTHFSFYNQYKGYIGRFFILANFENGPLEITSRCEIE